MALGNTSAFSSRAELESVRTFYRVDEIRSQRQLARHHTPITLQNISYRLSQPYILN